VTFPPDSIDDIDVAMRVSGVRDADRNRPELGVPDVGVLGEPQQYPRIVKMPNQGPIHRIVAVVGEEHEGLVQSHFREELVDVVRLHEHQVVPKIGIHAIAIVVPDMPASAGDAVPSDVGVTVIVKRRPERVHRRALPGLPGGSRQQLSQQSFHVDSEPCGNVRTPASRSTLRWRPWRMRSSTEAADAIWKCEAHRPFRVVLDAATTSADMPLPAAGCYIQAV